MLCQINSDHVMTYLGYLHRSSGPSEIHLLFSGQVVQQAVKTQAESPEGLPALKAMGNGVGFAIDFQTTPDIWNSQPAMKPCKQIHALWSLWRLMCLGSIANFTATRLVSLLTEVGCFLQNGILCFGSVVNSYTLRFPFSRWDRSLDHHDFISRVKYCWFRGSTSARLWFDGLKIRAYWINPNQPSCTHPGLVSDWATPKP